LLSPCMRLSGFRALSQIAAALKLPRPVQTEAAEGTPFDGDSGVLPQRAPEARRHL